jgi:hypothetical protein
MRDKWSDPCNPSDSWKKPVKMDNPRFVFDSTVRINHLNKKLNDEVVELLELDKN